MSFLVSLLRSYFFGCVHATKLPRPLEKRFLLFACVIHIFRCITLNILHVLFPFLSYIEHTHISLETQVCVYSVLCMPFSYIFLCASIVYVMCIFVYFPFIPFDCVQFMKVASITVTQRCHCQNYKTYCDYIEKSILCKNGCDPTVKLCFISSIFFANITMCVCVCLCVVGIFLAISSNGMKWHCIFYSNAYNVLKM